MTRWSRPSGACAASRFRPTDRPPSARSDRRRPAVVILTARPLGAEVSVAAFLLSLIWVAQLAADLPAGTVASGIGERRALVLACGIEAFGMVGCATAPNLVVLGVSLGLLGVASSVFGLARQAYLTKAVPIHLRARALSTFGGVNRIGIFVGPFVGALVVAHWRLTAAYAVGFLSSTAALLCVLLVRDVTFGSERRRSMPHRSVAGVLAEHRRTLLTLGVGVLFIASARARRIALIPLFAEAIGLSAAQTSLVSASRVPQRCCSSTRPAGSWTGTAGCGSRSRACSSSESARCGGVRRGRVGSGLAAPVRPISRTSPSRDGPHG